MLSISVYTEFSPLDPFDPSRPKPSIMHHFQQIIPSSALNNFILLGLNKQAPFIPTKSTAVLGKVFIVVLLTQSGYIYNRIAFGALLGFLCFCEYKIQEDKVVSSRSDLDMYTSCQIGTGTSLVKFSTMLVFLW